MADGTRQYFHTDSLYCQGTSEATELVTMTVPEGVSRLWLIVSPAPKKYIQHRWLEKADNAEHWPYSFELEGTDLGDRATVYVPPTIDGRAVADITLTYDVSLPQLNSYLAIPVAVSGHALAQLGTALQLPAADIASRLVGYASSGPSQGKIMFYQLNPQTLALVSRGSTANGYGHWFNASGAVSDWAGGYLYSELEPSSMTFSIGQYPGRVAVGSDYTIGQALRYQDASGKEAVARFLFHVHITDFNYGAELKSIDYTVPTSTFNVQRSPFNVQRSTFNVYNLQGRKVGTPVRHGLYIVNGKKVVHQK